jgi:hypothetical protein
VPGAEDLGKGIFLPDDLHSKHIYAADVDSGKYQITSDVLYRGSFTVDPEVRGTEKGTVYPSRQPLLRGSAKYFTAFGLNTDQGKIKNDFLVHGSDEKTVTNTASNQGGGKFSISALHAKIEDMHLVRELVIEGICIPS